jgi:large subunit ribosomal protein L23
MKDPRQVIIRPIISERSYDFINDNRYTFEVAKTSNKIEIRDAVESIFDVHVLNVNTMNVKAKPKRVRYATGKTRTWKKAIVTLVAGETIEAFGV